MALWHCNQCGREFQASDGARAHFHRCTEEGMAQFHMSQIGSIPTDQAGRDNLWQGLLALVTATRPFFDNE